MFAFFTAFLYLTLFSSGLEALSGTLELQPIPVHPGESGSDQKIQPTTPVKISATLTNQDGKPSQPALLSVRYALAPPLEREAHSCLFQTETILLPSIPSGDTLTVTFKTPHLLPAIHDFVRDDWSMREYQLILTSDNQETTLGTLKITFSAYYYTSPCTSQKMSKT